MTQTAEQDTADTTHRDLTERVAEAIYEVMRLNDAEGELYPWVPGGNSLKQDEARRRAATALAGLR